MIATLGFASVSCIAVISLLFKGLPPIPSRLLPTQTRKTLLATVVTDSGHEILEILFVLQTGVVVNIVTDLALEDFLRGKWLHEKNRIIISHDELECVRVR